MGILSLRLRIHFFKNLHLDPHIMNTDPQSCNILYSVAYLELFIKDPTVHSKSESRYNLNPNPIWIHIRSGSNYVPKLKLYQVDRKLQIFVKCRVYTIQYTVVLLWDSSWFTDKNSHMKITFPVPPPPPYSTVQYLCLGHREFLDFFMYVIQQCFICRPTVSTGSDDAGIEPRTVAT